MFKLKKAPGDRARRADPPSIPARRETQDDDGFGRVYIWTRNAMIVVLMGMAVKAALPDHLAEKFLHQEGRAQGFPRQGVPVPETQADGRCINFHTKVDIDMYINDGMSVFRALHYSLQRMRAKYINLTGNSFLCVTYCPGDKTLNDKVREGLGKFLNEAMNDIQELINRGALNDAVAAMQALDTLTGSGFVFSQAGMHGENLKAHLPRDRKTLQGCGFI